MPTQPKPLDAMVQAPDFLANLDPDSLVYRGLATTGRAYALAEAFAMVRRLGDRIKEDMPDEELLQILVLNWSELLTWLEQAGIEARDELSLMHSELAQSAS